MVTVELLEALREGSQCLAHSGGKVSDATKVEAAGLTPRSWPPPVLSAAAVAETFTLNTEQRRAFQECAVTLAAQWANGLQQVAALENICGAIFRSRHPAGCRARYRQHTRGRTAAEEPRRHSGIWEFKRH